MDLESVLVPEIWVEISKATGVGELLRTTKEESNFDALMKFRIGVMREKGLKLESLQKAAENIEPLEGAAAFLSELRLRSQFVLLSDTFWQFARPLMEKLAWPLLFSSSLETAESGSVTGYKLWYKNGKHEAVRAFKSMNLKVFAAGGSFNNISMLKEADSACLYRAPQMARIKNPAIQCADSFGELLGKIDSFLR